MPPLLNRLHPHTELMDVAGAAVANVPVEPLALRDANVFSLVWVNAPVYRPPVMSRFPTPSATELADLPSVNPAGDSFQPMMSRVLGVSIA